MSVDAREFRLSFDVLVVSLLWMRLLSSPRLLGSQSQVPQEAKSIQNTQNK